MAGLPGQAMGYDRAITIFSPEGKLYQVEYAFEAVRKGWTSLGVKTKGTVVLLSEKKYVTKLMELDSIEKVFSVDEHIGVTFAGFGSDGRVLIDYARLVSIRHKLLYGDPITVEYLTKHVADVKHQYTQYGGVRPFGVSMIFGGVDPDGTPRLLRTEPGGQYIGYQAIAIGMGAQSANEYLEKHYNYELGKDETIELAFKAMIYSMQQRNENIKELTEENFDAGIALVETGKFRKLSKEEIKEILSRLIS
ncbi:MAG: archaeal proteasome endopeptidase complex subunit alpha [Desulfurococcales archaeon]|nr:archaeal proteasome endopeptidase complex subunit alpha [Desulfurococcales archaeon]MEB3758819.1 archaeal proteasome endopeptidase complex subunit alpha [Desulfurococcales archaeon]MEB3772833.1 archaeal proteasome endopeptidase complex subunit alpha [Desulfurococcales archaeon]